MKYQSNSYIFKLYRKNEEYKNYTLCKQSEL